MKRWTMIATSFLIVLAFNSNIYAIENNEAQMDELPNNGRIVINFLTMETDEKSSPVKDVSIDLFYLDEEDNEIDIRQLEELKNTTINLVSDPNGIIVINNLPYGLYKYKVTNVPMGYEFLAEEKYVGVDLLNTSPKLSIYLTAKIEMADGSTIEETPPKDEVEVKPPETIIDSPKDEEIILPPANEEEIVEEIEEEKGEALKINVNSLSTDIYEYEEQNSEIEQEEKDEEVVEDTKEDIMKNTVANARERFKKSKQDMIKKFREYKISDSIRVAINTVDNSVNKYIKYISDLPDNKDKKLKRFDRIVGDVYNSKKEKIYINPRIKAKLR